MPSITPVMSAILRLAWEISPMRSTTCSITSPPRAAVRADWAAMSSAADAACALLDTVPSSVCIAAVVCCSAPAASSLRRLRCSLPSAMPLLAPRMRSADRRMPPTRSPSWPCMSSTACCSRPSSSLRCTDMVRLRSPAAMASARRTVSCTGRVMLRVRVQAISVAASPPATTRPTVTAVAMRAASDASWRVCSSSFTCCTSMAWILAVNAAMRGCSALISSVLAASCWSAFSRRLNFSSTTSTPLLMVPTSSVVVWPPGV